MFIIGSSLCSTLFLQKDELFKCFEKLINYLRRFSHFFPFYSDNKSRFWSTTLLISFDSCAAFRSNYWCCIFANVLTKSRASYICSRTWGKAFYPKCLSLYSTSHLCDGCLIPKSFFQSYHFLK